MTLEILKELNELDAEIIKYQQEIAFLEQELNRPKEIAFLEQELNRPTIEDTTTLMRIIRKAGKHDFCYGEFAVSPMQLSEILTLVLDQHKIKLEGLLRKFEVL